MKRDAWEVMLESLVTGDVGGAIMNQEKRGQGDLVHSDTLPVRCPREELEALGFVFGDMADELFIRVTMPEGWKKEPTDHSMWSRLVDPQGRQRGSIFYKAAFYDRDAFMHLDCRFGYTIQPVGGYDAYETWEQRNAAPDEVVVKDCGDIVWRSEPQEQPADRKDAYDQDRQLRAQGKAWLDEHYPDWESPLSYWDDPA